MCKCVNLALYSCCEAMYNILCKTIGLCGELDEMDVPEEVHIKLFEVFEIEIED